MTAFSVGATANKIAGVADKFACEQLRDGFEII
jgi:hypothetical protein